MVVVPWNAGTKFIRHNYLFVTFDYKIFALEDREKRFISFESVFINFPPLYHHGSSQTLHYEYVPL